MNLKHQNPDFFTLKTRKELANAEMVFKILTLHWLLTQWIRIIQSDVRCLFPKCASYSLYFYCLFNYWELLQCFGKATEMSWGRARSQRSWQKRKDISIQVEFSVTRLLWIANAVQHLSISNTFAKQKEKARNTESFSSTSELPVSGLNQP